MSEWRETHVDRTSNRAWKRRRNYVILMRAMGRLNRPHPFNVGGWTDAVMETRPGLDRERVHQMVDDLFSLPDSEK